MIEVVQARSGDEVFKYNGRLLASRNDPRQESQLWLETYRSLIRGSKSAIVLGAGAGYHIERLISEYPSLPVYVIDPRTDICDRIKNKFGFTFSNIHFIDKAELISERALANTFVILKHIPSWFGLEEKFQSEIIKLSGRFEPFFSKFKNLRPGLAQLSDVRVLQAGPMSIKNVLSEPSLHNLNFEDVCCLKALGELVK